jgi:hypothetical protein
VTRGIGPRAPLPIVTAPRARFNGGEIGFECFVCDEGFGLFLWRIDHDAISSDAARAAYEDEHGHSFHTFWRGKKWIVVCCDLCHALGAAKVKR